MKAAVNLNKQKIKKNDVSWNRIWTKALPYIYLAPAFAFLVLFILQPFIFAVQKSFFRYDGVLINEFVGFANYVKLFTNDKLFWISIGNLLFFFLGMVITFQFPILAAELIFNLKSIRLQKIFRTALIIPIVVPLVVTLLVWKFIYYPGVGVFYEICKAIGIATKNIPNLLGDTALVKPAIMFIGFPWIAGLPFLVSFAALQGIDTSIMEAAKIDGCSTFRRIFNIDLPMIFPQLKVLFILGLISLIQDYERIFILTQGGPQNASLVPGLHMYNISFAPGSGAESLYGYSCAMAIVLFAISFAASAAMFRKKNNGEG